MSITDDITKQILDSVRDLSRRIRRLETQEVPLIPAIPDDICVVFTCGATGWRAEGGTISRTLIHELAFQLDADGDVRGEHAVDLQLYRFFANEVAGAYGSFAQGDESRIDLDADYSVVFGVDNYVINNGAATPYQCYLFGTSNDAFDDCYLVFIFGDSSRAINTQYAFLSGSDQDVVGEAFGVFAFIEGNTFIEVGTDYPTYTGIMGLFCVQEGDVWFTFQMGEELYASTESTSQTLWNAMIGFESYLGNVFCNFAFGQGLRSWAPATTDFYDGRILWSGDYPNKWPATGSPKGSGYNQDSMFSQNDLILSWPAAFTTSRFEFPIIVDSVWYFIAYISGTEQGCSNSYAWKIEGVVENDGGTTTILVSTVTNVYRDVITKEWQAAADDANDRLIFQYRDTAGPDLTDCNIQFLLQTIEVGWAA